MSLATNIQWCCSTWSPWLGCRKVSEGCENCYITGTTPFRVRGLKHGATRQRTSESYWRQPLLWNKKAAATGQSRTVFPSLCDIFDAEVEPKLFTDFLYLVFQTQHLTWLLLTKRTALAIDRLETAANWAITHAEDYDTDCLFIRWLEDWIDGKPPVNVHLGASCEDQAAADLRIPQLLAIPAVSHFVSAEPLLGPIDFMYSAFNGIDWVIFGGESGPRARPCNIGWIRAGVRQCRNAGVAAFVKQLGANATHYLGDKRIDHISALTEEMQNIPFKVHDKKGGDMAEWPQDLRVREFPRGTQ